MKSNKRPNLALNLLIAIVVSLVVNFYYLVFMMVGDNNQSQQSHEPHKPKSEVVAPTLDKNSNEEHTTPLLATAEDEEATEVEAESSGAEEIIIREESIAELSRHRHRANPMATDKGRAFMWLDMLYYVVVAMMFLEVMTHQSRHTRGRKGWKFVWRLVLCVGLLAVCYMMAPQLTWKGDIIITATSRRLLNPMLLLKLSATFVVAALYGKIYQMHYKQQEIELENERLKNESLTWQYNTLVNQVNPHFLFNSLNSLSMLVREEKRDDALTYIDQMSDTYRYIIQDGTAELTTVENELRFVEAYRYLLEIRYAGKLHVEVDVAKEYLGYLLPPLSLQPLIENAVKHNTITSSRPMTISITAHNNHICVANTINPKLEAEESTGIGLANLSRRYSLVMGSEVVVENDGSTFKVCLPIREA